MLKVTLVTSVLDFFYTYALLKVTLVTSVPDLRLRITSLTNPRSVPSLFIVRYLPVAGLISLTRLGPNDCISNNTGSRKTHSGNDQVLHWQ